MKIDAAVLDQVVRFSDRAYWLDPPHEVETRQNTRIFENLGARQARDMAKLRKRGKTRNIRGAR